MSLFTEYRWNVPKVTYGFDPSFVEYFGTNGIRAVEAAIDLINVIPPAADLALDAYPRTDVRRANWEAMTLHCLDLKSVALQRLLEQLGLAQSIRWLWCVRGRTVVESNTWYSIIRLNYDPSTLNVSSYVNGMSFGYKLYDAGGVCDALETSGVYFDGNPTAVAEQSLGVGEFIINLSRDDVGALSHLLRPSNWNVETVLPGVTAAGPDPMAFVNAGSRPGMNKITFVRHPWDAERNRFVPWTNNYFDTVIPYGQASAITQTLQRVVREPDFLFTVQDMGLRFYEDNGQTHFWSPVDERSDTSHWINLETLNDPMIPGGPGLIAPPIRITFQKLGKYNHIPASIPFCPDEIPHWATFDGSTNEIRMLDGNERAGSATVSNRVVDLGDSARFEWKLLGVQGAVYRIETGSDMDNWSLSATVTNNTGYFDFVGPANGPRRFYRAVMTTPWPP